MIFQTSIEFYTRVFVAKDYYSRWSGGPNLLPESSRVCQLVSRARFAEASKLSHDLPVKIGFYVVTKCGAVGSPILVLLLALINSFLNIITPNSFICDNLTIREGLKM